jgi:hypothetical protein
MAGISNCRYCDQQIIWILRPNGSWQRPFDAPRELIGLDYEVSWDAQMGDWMAAPIDLSVTAKLVQHDCPKRAELLAERRAKLQAEQELRPAMERLFGPPPDEEDIGLPSASEVLMREALIPTRRRLPERVVYRDPAPEKFIRVALQLRARCPKCGAMPFEWCAAMDNAANQKAGRVGDALARLHRERDSL